MVAASFWTLFYWTTFLAVTLYLIALVAVYLTWREQERDRKRRAGRLRDRRYQTRRWDGTEIRP